MYTKEEASKIRQQFWITFGKYMKPIPSAEGAAINWINYKTGIKHIAFKMDVDTKHATIGIVINHPSASRRDLFFEQFKAFRTIFTNELGEEWDWQAEHSGELDLPFSQISKTLSGVNIYNQQDWPALITFLKTRIVALDRFWVDVKPFFEGL